jgi:hypothetical protein
MDFGGGEQGEPAPSTSGDHMVRKLVAGIALTGMLVLGGVDLARAQDDIAPSPTTQAAPEAKSASGCAWAGRLLGYLEKVQERGTALLAWLEGKQAEIAQGNPEIAARVTSAMTAIRTRLDELKQHVPALRARLSERCPAGS